MATKKIKSKLKKKQLPKVKIGNDKKNNADFPVAHYSASSMVQFTTNPILWKIKYVNRDQYDTTMNISGVIGQAFHKAMEVYYGGNEDMKPKNESEAIEFGLKTGIGFLENYQDGFISYSKTVPVKQKALEIFSFIYTSYIKQIRDTGEKTIATEDHIEEKIDIVWKGRKLNLPVKLKGYLDRIVMTADDKLIIKDYKTCRSFSNPDKIDGAKIIQAVTYYLLAYAKYGVEPYAMEYEEVKTAKDKNGKQVQVYQIVFADNELYFDFFFRLYEDITNALNGNMVYVPNVQTLYDNEVAIISYIHHLDSSEERARQMQRLKVDNITDLLKKKIQNAGSMRKFMKAVEQQFVSAKNLNYNTMENHEKIQTKLMEYGMLVDFDSKIDGATVDLYRFTPSIGLKMSKLKNFVADIEQVLGKSGVRVLAPIPNTTFVGFEVPRDERVFPKLPESNGFDLAIGQTIMGDVRTFDVRSAPHMLVAGSTGSGKSVFLNSLIKQLIKLPNVELHLFDPKQVELFQYEGDVTEYKHNHNSIALALNELVEEMERRYTVMKKAGVRNIDDMPKLKYKFIIIDEYADLAMREETAINIQLLAQKGRACGMHIIIATQRASTRVINGDIKINFPVKVVFRMSKGVDSRIMIDEDGAERLIGKGDCLFSTDAGIERLQGYLC